MEAGPASKMGTNAKLPVLKDLYMVTDIEQARALLEATLDQEKQIHTDLENILLNAEEVESTLATVEEIPIRIKPVQKETTRLLSTISNTCSLANAVSAKIRDLDSTRERIQLTMNKLHDIIDVKNCVSGVEDAMAKEDYETAASHIGRYLTIGNAVALSSVLEETASNQLKTAENKLKEIVKQKLEQAIRADDQPNIIRFCLLYAPLGLKEEGLTRYSHYLRKLVSTEADYIIKNLLRPKATVAQNIEASGGEQLSYADGLARLYEFIAGIIDEQQSLVEEHFGPGSMVVVIKNLQQQCDVHSTKILSLFSQDTNMLKMIDDIVRSERRERRSDARDAIDPRDLAGLLDTIAILNHRTEVYDRFIRTRARLCLENAGQTPKHPGHPSSMQDGLIHCSELNRSMQEMMGHYIKLEEYYMIQSVKKAVAMDSHSQESITTTMVDYVFFVLQSCTQRALSTHNVNSMCAIVNMINTTLNIDYKEVLQTMLAEYSAGKGPTGDHRTDYMIVLNNIEVSCEYILKLKANLEAEESNIFTDPVEKEKMKSCIHDLLETSRNYKQLLHNNLEQVAQTITPSIRPLIEIFSAVNYQLNEAEYAEYEINDPFVYKITAGLDNLFAPFKMHLTEGNYDGLVHIVIHDIATRLEKALFQKRFNQFDKDLRRLVSYFTSVAHNAAKLTGTTVRGEFARLSQIASLLNLEKVSEVMEYWDENARLQLRLTPGEVRKVLARRVEFRAEDIARLKL
ncbi:COG4 transport protein [Acanthamoeba castellanii str. Neff]|uniref:Conserved oligomeric Golgi complex subunit 4 n=1 Tax=Acanthamoeba castellanii (strain ATCC 30010 / Neff) TaxID=1257118 RepID=L8H4D2_ACACF|nr:COG4 transport protein [Acanthamoeba castellanii str. Neff]ELR19326.1 COG4 transport protein [Acanthamoeba castellanii str. Neff]